MSLPQITVFLVGLLTTLSGLALLFAQQWFFDTIAPFAPFNRHFIGDIGAFNLPIGVGLLYAAYSPVKYMALLVLGLWASIIHALNHLYDDVILEGSFSHFLRDGLPIALVAVALAWAWWVLRKEVNR